MGLSAIKKRYGYIYRWLYGYRGVMLNVLISSVLVTFLGMNWPLVYRYIVNKVFYDGSIHELWFILVVYAMLFVSEKALQFIWKLSEAVIASDYTYKVQKILYKKYYTIKMSEKEKYSAGEILDILNNDVKQIYTFLIDEGIFAITSFIRLIMAMIYIFLINKAASVFILSMVVINFYLSKYLRNRLMKYYEKYKINLEQFNSFLIDILTGLKEIKLFSSALYIKEKFISKTMNLCGLQKEQLIEQTYREIASDILSSCAEGILYVAAAFSIINGNMLLGDFISLMIYYEWAKIFFAIFTQLFSGASKSNVSIDRINKLMNAQDENDEGKDVINGDIIYNNICFQYDNRNKVLNNFNLEVKKGSTIAIVGDSGAGKSTLVNLLLKLYEPTSGSIYIDGKNIHSISARKIRQIVGVVSQNARLFEGSIRQNLLMGKEDATDDELWTALSIAKAKEFVSELPQNLDTEINSVDNLSTGQIQRIILARIVLKNPDIVILDEATSNIDIKTEKELLVDVASIFSNKTVIIIAYRAASLEIAEKIFYLRDGKIQSSGTHEELLLCCSRYRNLVYVSERCWHNGENKNIKTIKALY